MNRNNLDMEGILYLTDEDSKKKFVQIDLEKHGKIWEDFYDGMMAELAKDDETIDFEDFKKELAN